MADLPSEILSHHIFVRLPVNSILRFKCVCKAWNRMLNHPQFPRMHLAQYQSSEILLLSNDFDCYLSTALNFYSLDYESSSNGAVDAVKLHYSPLNHSNMIDTPSRIVGRCNGLLLCLAQIKNPASEVQDRDLILWNPSISVSKVIRAPNTSLIEFHLVGFGYDSSTDDYKIVRIINGTGTNLRFMVFNHQKECRVDIYSLKTDSWKTIECDAPRLLFGFHSDRGAGCAAHGSIYWLQFNPYRGIFGFDLKDNKFRELQSLPNDLAPRYDMSLKALGESLGIYQYDSDNNKLVAWTTKAGKKEEWIKLMTLYTYPDPHEVTTHRTRPVTLMKNGKVLVHLLQVLLPDHKIQNKFVLYDPKRESVEDFHIRGISDVRWMSLITYIENLILPNFGGEGY